MVDTPYCQIISWPTFDLDVIPLFENKTKETIECRKPKTVAINRKDFNGIEIEKPFNKSLKCFARSIKRRDKSDERIVFTAEAELNLNEINYFKDVIAVKVNCSVDESESYFEGRDN